MVKFFKHFYPDWSPSPGHLLPARVIVTGMCITFVSHSLTMLKPASIVCDSKCIVDSCNGQAKKWQRNEWRTAVVQSYIQICGTNFDPFGIV